MMIKEQVKALWKICFDDSEEFVEMYFRLRYKTEVNVAIQSGDEVISALQMLPYPMTFGGETVQTSYISGACTHPDFRSKGVMRELLSQSFALVCRCTNDNYRNRAYSIAGKQSHCCNLHRACPHGNSL